MTDRIEIYDTTLRDGSQGEGVNFSVEDKCRVAEQLDALGVDGKICRSGKLYLLTKREPI